ncbi:MAG: hypothetical protein CFE45_12715, partial [Burkholderiales bacterium PBB5]
PAPAPAPAPPAGPLVVALSSRALFDFEAENRVFENADDHAYMQLQLQQVDEPARPGVAFGLARKLLAFNAGASRPRVEVVILSRNDPVSGLRVFRSAQHYGLAVERGVFTRGESPWRYLRPLKAQLFLSANEADVRSALEAGVPAAVAKPARDPAAILAGQVPPDKPADKPADKPGLQFYVQAGAYARPDDAEGQRARLGLLGLSAKVMEREQSGRTVYRVRLGPFASRDEAEATQAKLGEASIESSLVRVER